MRRLFIALLVVVLAGCGFQLRRDLLLPPELGTLHIEAVDPQSELVRGLGQALRRSGTSLVAADVDGAARLRLTDTSMRQRPLSVGGTGRVQEFALVYATRVELVDAAGAIRLPAQEVALERVYSFDTADALGTPGEEEVVRAELEREMVAALLRRIEAALR